MKDESGRKAIRLGDPTSHGGKVISASDTLKAMGKAVALDGDMTICPKCKGQFAIRPNENKRTHHGKAVAYNGDKSECGASLISSL